MRLRKHLLIALGSASLLCSWRAPAPRATPPLAAVGDIAPTEDRVAALADREPPEPAPREPAQVLAAIGRMFETDGARDRPELEHEIAAQLAALLAGGHLEAVQAAVAQWARGPRAAYLGSAPIAVVSETLLHSSPIAAFAWLTSLPESRSRDAALERVIAAWALDDPRVALACAQGLVMGDTRRRAIVQALEPWLAREPLNATRWLAEHESDPLIDRIIADVIAGSFGQTYPQLASHWARVIADPELRGQAAAYLESHERFSAVSRRWSLAD